MTLRIGLPSKGRLSEKTFNWFGARGLTISNAGAEREYTVSVDADNVEIVLLSVSDIVRELASGRIHLGVTGTDLIEESLADWETSVGRVVPLGFGHADLVLAVPKIWVDVDSLDDLDVVCASFRAKHGFRLRIATKYHRLTRDFLRRAGVADYQLVESHGATEGAVKNQAAEAIADITSTGETMRANHLKPLADGLIHKSQATLFVSKKLSWSVEERAILDGLLQRLNVNSPDFL